MIEYDLPHLIVEISDADEWPALHAGTSAKDIPLARRPRALQPNRKIAEAEALRLAQRHPGKRFVVFVATAVGMTVEVPTHVNIRGEVKCTDRRAAVLGVDDGEASIPF